MNPRRNEQLSPNADLESNGQGSAESLPGDEMVNVWVGGHVARMRRDQLPQHSLTEADVIKPKEDSAGES